MERGPQGRRARRRFRGNLLRELRDARGLTQDDLANIFHVTRFTISKWENERDNPDPSKVKIICYFFEKPPDYFYDRSEQQTITASVVLGHLATFTQVAPIVVKASRRILVFQSGAPKAPMWWRQNLREHLLTIQPEIEFRAILCVDQTLVSRELLDQIAKANEQYAPAPHQLQILEQKPQLGIDVLVIDNRYVSLSLLGHTVESRQCSIYFENEQVGDALSRWLLTLSPLLDYAEWRAKHEKRLAIAAGR